MSVVKRAAYPMNEVSFCRIDPTKRGESWRAIQNQLEAFGHHLSDWAVRILRDGLDEDLRCVVCEPYYVCKDHANLHSFFYSKKFVPKSNHSARLHFFNRLDIDKTTLVLQPREYEQNYLGFSVIRPVAERCIGRTVIDPLKIRRGARKGFYVLRTPFKVRIFGPEFSVAGFPYTSQDSDAMLCGHTALWSICRYLSERYPKYRELLPYDLISMTRKEAGRVVPHRGMGPEDYSAILSEFGTHPIILEMRERPEKREIHDGSFRDLCAYVESGVPLLASFRGHAVTIIGHTLDWENPPVIDDGWLIDHSCFFDSLVSNDDNRFPYVRLPRDPHRTTETTSMGRKNGTKRYFIEDLTQVVCPLPEKVFLTAAHARNVCGQAVNLCRRKLEALAGGGPFVTRLFFTNSAAFKRRRLETLKNRGQLAGVPFFVAQLHLPHFIWVMEIAPLRRYREGLRCGEFVLDATAGRKDNALIYSLIGNTIEYDNAEESFPSSPLEYSQFTHNLGEH
jgi:hypothetical protein